MIARFASYLERGTEIFSIDSSVAVGIDKKGGPPGFINWPQNRKAELSDECHFNFLLKALMCS